MKLFNINPFDERKKIAFDGIRVNRNAISQLTKNNPYSLTEPNQRFISKAIEEMGKVKGLNNIKFLLNSAAKVTYVTNIQNDIPAKNDWKGKLLEAALSAIALTPFVPKAIKEKIAEISNNKELTEAEKEIVNLGNQLLRATNLEQINNELNGPMKEFKKNLNYFIVSSETTLEHKKYVLERLNYFMSDDYEINPQLADKKSIVLAEMVNDMTITVPGNEIPNIKAVNQKAHGMCGTISIVRKKLVYEDKPKFVDTILSELDNTPHIMVYDRNKLGSGEKIPVRKVPVDFNAAINLGYRIIDASTLHWMQISSMGGSNNMAYEEYHPFDKENFDVNADAFFNVKIADERLQEKQEYFQALSKAKSVIENYIASEISLKVRKQEAYSNFNKQIEILGKTKDEIKSSLIKISKDFTNENLDEIISKLFKLEKSSSKKIKENDKFSFVQNEEFKIKSNKIKQYLAQYTQEEISDKNIEELYGLIGFYKQNTPIRYGNGGHQRVFAQAEELYDIAAAFRYQLSEGLDIDENVNILIQAEGLPTKEEILMNTFDILIKNIKEKTEYSDKIIEQIAENLDINKDETEVLDTLEYLQAKTDIYLEGGLSEIYKSLTLGSKYQSLYDNMTATLEDVVNNNSETIKTVAEMLEVKPSAQKIAKILEKDIKELVENKDAKTYRKLLLKYGNSSEILHIKDVYKDFVNQLAFGIDENFLMEFVNINGINIEENPDAFSEKLEEIQGQITAIESFLEQTTKALKVIDDDGEVLFSASPKDVIIKQFEQSERIPNYKSLKELQAHKDKVSKIWSKNEFGNRKDIKKIKGLFELNKNEKNTIKIIKENINDMHKYIQKELTHVRRDIKEPLEELNQIIGINQGDYWVNEGSSGVSSAQEIRAVEYLTGRPHYSTNDFKKAAEIIKTSPYSGITGSQVRHNQFGAHAQYVADIEPIKIKIKDENGNEEIVEKDVLFHDNTWGVSEKDNTWVDSQGLVRTDYNRDMGGTLGYITNSNYRNGNLVDRISNEMLLEYEPTYINSKAYNKIRPFALGEKYVTQQYNDIILDGKAPDLKDLAAKVHDTLFSANNKYLQDLEAFASNKSEEELQAEITKTKGYDRSWEKPYKNLEARILGDFLTTPIKTKEEYEALADDDYLKVTLEKVALTENFSTAGLTADIVSAKNVKELDKIKTTQKRRAINSFKYSFAKLPSVIAHLAREFDDKEARDIQAILDKHNIKLNKNEEDLLYPNFVIETKEFNGSAKHTITLLLREISKSVNKVIQNDAAKEEIKNYYRNFFIKNLYFNAKNLQEKDELNINHLVDFIDRVYDPTSDEEFVKIFRKIQNMTTEEFKKEVLPKATNKDMNLDELTGFDILKRLQFHDEDTFNALQNAVILDKLQADLNLKKYNPEYVNRQLTRYAKFKTNNSFRYNYNSIQSILSLLTLEKLFNKYKGRHIKHGHFPAYPKTEIMSEELFNTSFDNAIAVIEGNVHKIKGLQEQLENYEISHKLAKYLNKLSEEDIPSDYQYKKINTLLGRLITLNTNDPTMAEALENAEIALEFEKGTSWEYYIPAIYNIVETISAFENTTSKDQILGIMESLKNEISIQEKVFAEALVQKKYQNRIIEDMNELKQALVKDKPEKAEELKEKFYNNFVKAHILNNPSELLDSYLKSLTKDSPLRRSQEAFKVLVERGMAFAKLAEVQELLMEAVSDGKAINIKSMFDEFSVPLNIGEFKMSSDEVIAVMVNSLIINEEQDTALLFIDKLGLGEQYVRYITKTINLDAMKKAVDNAHKLSKSFNDFHRSLEPTIQNITEILCENNENFLGLMDNLKKEVRKQAKAFDIDKSMQSLLLRAVDNMKLAFISNPESKQLFIFSTLIKEALEGINQMVQDNVSGINQMLNSNNTLVNLANNIPLHANSEATKLREEFNAKYSELSNYSQALNQEAEEDLQAE